MSDYRDPDSHYRNPDDPVQRAFEADARAGNATWGWVAAAVFLGVVLAVAFGAGHQPGRGGTETAFNGPAPPAVTHMTAPTFAPAPVTPAAPITPAPNTPAQPGINH